LSVVQNLQSITYDDLTLLVRLDFDPRFLLVFCFTDWDSPSSMPRENAPAGLRLTSQRDRIQRPSSSFAQPPFT
jgi:hypothetical protein